jgi:hypothetical protein
MPSRMRPCRGSSKTSMRPSGCSRRSAPRSARSRSTPTRAGNLTPRCGRVARRIARGVDSAHVERDRPPDVSPAVRARQGARVHDRAVAGAHGLPRPRGDPAGQQHHRAGAARGRSRAQESLRLTLRTRDAGRGALLLVARVREARGHRSGAVPRRGDPPRDRDPRHGYAWAAGARASPRSSPFARYLQVRLETYPRLRRGLRETVRETPPSW